ncbi:MAG: coenzyme F420-0:L-glutamate ligase, partial [Myxococcota bacterium]
MKALQVFPVTGIPAIKAGDPLGGMLARAAGESAPGLAPGDVLAVCQKVVSKAEGRVVRLPDVTPSPRALAWAREHRKDPRLVEIVLKEATRIVRMEKGLIIAETAGGLVCANAGVDQSNTDGPDEAVLLPLDPDASAERLREEIAEVTGSRQGVVITDTFGR